MTDTEPTSSHWAPPLYDLSKPPSGRSAFQLSPSGQARSNFARCAKIAPDGLSFIAQCEDHSLQIFDVPNAVSGSLDQGGLETTVATPLLPRLNLQQPAPVVDFAWFPSASKHDPATYCLAASVRECPVKLLDANTGKLRASYRIVDHRERQIAPHSLAFTFSGERLYCGFEDAIEVFDIASPGEGTRMHTSPSKKSKDGLKGIISALAFSPSHSASDEQLFAAGSLTPVPGNIGLYSDVGSEALMFLGGGPRAGVTQLQFNHYRPHMLYAKYRGNANGMIYSWDIRSHIDAPVAIYDGRPAVNGFAQPTAMDSEAPEVENLARIHQQEASPTARNQKSRFDLDIGGRYIGSGNWDGDIVVFDVEKTELKLLSEVQEDMMDLSGLETDFAEDDMSSLHVQPILRFRGHQDTVASVTFQPWSAGMLTVSGSRHFGSDEEGSEDGSDDEGESMETDRNTDGGSGSSKRVSKTKGPSVVDNSIRSWSFAPSNMEVTSS